MNFEKNNTNLLILTSKCLKKNKNKQHINQINEKKINKTKNKNKLNSSKCESYSGKAIHRETHSMNNNWFMHFIRKCLIHELESWFL